MTYPLYDISSLCTRREVGYELLLFLFLFLLLVLFLFEKLVRNYKGLARGAT